MLKSQVTLGNAETGERMPVARDGLLERAKMKQWGLENWQMLPESAAQLRAFRNKTTRGDCPRTSEPRGLSGTLAFLQKSLRACDCAFPGPALAAPPIAESPGA